MENQSESANARRLPPIPVTPMEGTKSLALNAHALLSELLMTLET